MLSPRDLVGDLGSRISDRLRELRLPRSVFSKVIGAGLLTTYKWDYNEGLPRTELLPYISAALNVRLEWLLTGALSTEEYISTVVNPVQRQIEILRQDMRLKGSLRSELVRRATYVPEVLFYKDEVMLPPRRLTQNQKRPPETHKASAVEDSLRDKTASAPDRPQRPSIRMSPVKDALLAIITEALEKGALSDNDCLSELVRWHEINKGSKPHD